MRKTIATIAAMLCATALLAVCTSSSVQMSFDDPDSWIGADDALDVGPGGLLYNQKGQELVLRGINIGGWMLQESWMCPVYGADKVWANMDTIKVMEGRGWDAAQIQELFDTYQDNWITVDDFNFFKSCGVNSIRLPFWYRNFMSDDEGAWINNDDGSQSGTVNPGFKRLDWAITQAKKRGIYIILDLHGAVGGQSVNHSTGTLNKNELFTNPSYEEATVDLWKAIARRYKDEATVAAYDLLNEPQNNGGSTGTNVWAPGSIRAIHETVRIYDRLYREVRAVDPSTIVIMEGIWDVNLPDPNYVHAGPLDINERFSGKTVAWDKNVMYSLHIYDHDRDLRSPPQNVGTIDYRVYDLTEARKKWGVAIHVGEFNNGDQNQVGAYQIYNANKISWNMWTYKLASVNMGNWSLYQSPFKANANPNTDSIETMKQRWGETLRTFKQGTLTPANGFTQTDMQYIYTTGQKHRINGVFTNSNQAGVPTGGTTGPILVDDNDTGSSLLAADSSLGNVPAKPVISPESVMFNTSGRQTVSITVDAPDAVIRYVTGDVALTEDSPQYTGPLSIDLPADKPFLVKARAFKDGAASPMAIAEYTVRKTAMPVFGFTESWPSGPFSLAMNCPDTGAEIWYTLNNGAETRYQNPITVSVSTTVRAYAVRSGLSRSDTAMRVYKYGTLPKMYHNFKTLAGVKEGSATRIETVSSDWEYTANSQALAMSITSSGEPSVGNRSVTVSPEGGGVFDAAGYNYLIIVLKDPGNNSFWINFNRAPIGINSGWSDHANIGAVPAASVAGQWAVIVIPAANAGARISNITFGEWNSNTYLIDSIYFAMNADDPPL